MKICHVCGVEFEDSVELCTVCGADLTVSKETKEESPKTIENPVLLVTLEDVVSAEIFKDILKENNIPYFCDNSAGAGTMQVLFGGSFIAENIYVDKSDYDAADVLYTEFLENEPQFDGEFFEEDYEDN